MLLTLLQFFATKFLFLALHLESGCFPRQLTAREEAAAFSALRAGDAAAREKLIRHNLRLVAHIVKILRPAGRSGGSCFHRHHRADESGRYL